ncbi:hypothetical protein L209DRAFT_434 [Thermothelomyces heterothallicus CBS 203.75]
MGMRSASDWAGQRQPAPAAANRRVLAASSQAQDSAHAWTPLQIRCGAVIGDQAGAAGQGGNALGFTTKRHSTKPAQSQPCMRSTLMPRPRPTRVLERHSFAVQLVLSTSKGTRRWTERRQHWRPACEIRRFPPFGTPRLGTPPGAGPLLFARLYPRSFGRQPKLFTSATAAYAK